MEILIHPFVSEANGCEVISFPAEKFSCEYKSMRIQPALKYGTVSEVIQKRENKQLILSSLCEYPA